MSLLCTTKNVFAKQFHQNESILGTSLEIILLLKYLVTSKIHVHFVKSVVIDFILSVHPHWNLLLCFFSYISSNQQIPVYFVKRLEILEGHLSEMSNESEMRAIIEREKVFMKNPDLIQYFPEFIDPDKKPDNSQKSITITLPSLNITNLLPEDATSVISDFSSIINSKHLLGFPFLAALQIWLAIHSANSIKQNQNLDQNMIEISNPLSQLIKIQIKKESSMNPDARIHISKSNSLDDGFDEILVSQLPKCIDHQSQFIQIKVIDTPLQTINVGIIPSNTFYPFSFRDQFVEDMEQFISNFSTDNFQELVTEISLTALQSPKFDQINEICERSQLALKFSPTLIQFAGFILHRIHYINFRFQDFQLPAPLVQLLSLQITSPKITSKIELAAGSTPRDLIIDRRKAKENELSKNPNQEDSIIAQFSRLVQPIVLLNDGHSFFRLRYTPWKVTFEVKLQGMQVVQ